MIFNKILGLTFKNKHSSEFDLGFRSNRPLAPARKNVQQYDIPGIPGKVIYDIGEHDVRKITLRIVFLGDDFEELRRNSRKISAWLSGEGFLKFDDEPNIGYNAVIIETIPSEQKNTLPIIESTVVFQTEPYAETEFYKQSLGTAGSVPMELITVNEGTAKTSCIITIKNIGATNIKNIVISRKVVID